MSTRTAQQRRAAAKVEFDAYLATCPSRVVLERISDKWVSLVVCALGEQDLRFAQLHRRIAGVSQKMLTQTLRNLERDGLVTRTVEATVPVSVTYGLTVTGRDLHRVLLRTKQVAEELAPAILRARADFDAAADVEDSGSR
ncbi:winged helix-turn-helix transcriptional regulator [Dermacoccaceae bacterium W4C1]